MCLFLPFPLFPFVSSFFLLFFPDTILISWRFFFSLFYSARCYFLTWLAKQIPFSSDGIEQVPFVGL